MNEFCGCCEGLEPITPIANANRPGLPALNYRVGTHATFLETMLARLSSNNNKQFPAFPALADLKTRSTDDPSIALLDAWATVADVLTFYQERIANEGYLRTATERRSILELARLVGYSLRPGVSASVFPAFMMEIDYNSPEAQIPAGTRIQSTPAPGEMPQFFETAEKIAARTKWNEIQPRQTRPLIINQGNARFVETVYLKGITTNLRAGDPLLLTFRFKTTDIDANYLQPEPILRKVAAVDPKAIENFTKVTLQPEPLDDRAFLDAFKETVEKYINPDRLPNFPIDRAGRFFILIRNLLDDLKKKNTATDVLTKAVEYTKDIPKASGDTTENDEQKKQREERESIRDALFRAIFNLKKFNVESIWLDRLLTELEKIVRAWYLSLKDDLRQISATTGTNTLLKSEVLSWANWLQKLNESSPQQTLDWYLAWLADKYNPARSSSVEGVNFIIIPEDPKLSIPSFDRLSEIVAPLSQSPSLPPANRFQLDRPIGLTFNPDSDLRPRLLETLDPKLASTLYQTLASEDRLPALSLKTPEAMRVKAAPFGHNAPLRPIYASNGSIVGYEEWPIATTSIKIQISPPTGRGEGEIFELPVTISIQLNSQIESRDVRLRAAPPGTTEIQTININGINVRIDIPDNIPSVYVLRFTFQFSREKVKVIEIDVDDGAASATIDSISLPPDSRISPNNTIREQFGDRRILLSVFRNENSSELFSSIFVLDESPDPVLPQNRKIVFLDTQYDQIQSGGWISIARPSGIKYYQVIDTQTVSLKDYGISGRVTQLTLNKEWLTDNERSLSDLRNVTIYAQSEGLELAEEPLTIEPVGGDKIELGTIYDGLKAGRWMIVSGDRVDVPNTKASELVMLAGVQNQEDPPGSKPYSVLTFSTKLAYVYKRDTFKIYGNVVKATHGETRVEVLGSGDGSQAFQQFILRQPPLTYLSAPTPAGAADTLEVRVNDVLWHETDSLSELAPTDRLYALKTDDDAMTTVIFGNGTQGSRLPTGIENIRAVYRNGIGKVGNVKAEQINLLATRPLGLKGVINPLPAAGGADRESRDRARENAPLAVMALDRLVSVQDYTDFARTFAGIGKASAQKLTDGTRQIVHVTIAGEDDIPIDPSSDLYRNLLKAMRDFGDPNQPIRLAVRKLVLLLLAAKVKVLPDYQWEKVEPQIRAALLANFGFERRQLGQSVWLSDIISIVQQVPGVAYVDVDLFDSVSEDDVRTPSTIKRVISLDGVDKPIEFQQETNKLVFKLKELPTTPPQNKVDADLAKIDRSTREIKPAQLAIFSPKVADTMILTELKP